MTFTAVGAAGARAWLPLVFLLWLIPSAEAGEVEKLFERSVPESLSWPLDVRLEDRDTAVLAAGRSGVFRFDLSEARAKPRQMVAGEEVTFASRLGLSGEWVVAGVTFGPLGWGPRDGEGDFVMDAPMSVILDLDVRDDQVWILGSRRDESGEFAPEGVIAWSGELKDGALGDLTPRIYAESGPGAEEMARCYILETGAVRSLGKDRWVVVPGVQPGVFIYSDKGMLVRAWQSEDLGFKDRCDLDYDEFIAVNGDLETRNAWLNRRRVVDDVVAWDGDPTLVIRQVTPKGPRWRLLRLAGDEPEWFDLPDTVGGPNARVRGDVLGDRLVLLMTEYEYEPSDRTEKPKVLVYKLPSE